MTVARAVHVGALILSLTLGPVSAQALKVRLSDGLNARQYEEGELKATGFLAAGSEVEIPDEYIQKRGNKIDLELTLNKWLKEAGSLGNNPVDDSAESAGNQEPDRFRFNGKRYDYFFPVKVTRAVGKQPEDRNGKGTQYIALSYLARKGRALVVTETATTFAEPPKVTPPARTNVDADSPTGSATGAATADTTPSNPTAIQETSGSASAGATAGSNENHRLQAELTPCETGNCTGAPLSPAVELMLKKLKKPMEEADARYEANSRRTKDDLDKLERNFKRTCGFELKEFLPIVERESTAAGVPTSAMLSKMILEASGKCFEDAPEKNKTESRGLFGINTGSASPEYRHDCTPDQERILRATKPANLASGPRCTQNPLINLREAIRIYKEKPKTLRAELQKFGIDFDSLSAKNQERLTTSAYNGGEKWVIQAVKDLVTFNKKWGTTYDANNWEDLRVFYFRSDLDNRTENYLFGRRDPHRKHSNILTNLAYIENVVPRDERYRAAGVTPLVEMIENRLLAKKD
jgi:hypothetical protein